MSGENLKIPQLNISLSSTGADSAAGEPAFTSAKPMLFNTGLIDAREYAINGQEQNTVSNVNVSLEQALFESKLKTQQAQVKPEELPANIRTGALAAIGNYLNRIKYGVDKLDTAIDDRALDVLQRYSIPESDLKTMYESNPRLQAIIYQMLQAGANYGIQMG